MNLQSVISMLPDTDKNVVSILSGGLDSTIMTYILVEKYGSERVFALSYNYGQKQKRELEMAAKTCSHLGVTHKVLDLAILGDIAKNVCANISGTDVAMPTIRDVLGDPQPKTYVPFRNMILNSLGFSFAEANQASHIFTGLQSTDEYSYWDTTLEFIRDMNRVASHNRTFLVQMVAPFADISKTDEVAIAQEIKNVRLDYTLTCYNPDEEGRSCGRCPSCAERIKGFMNNKLIDPVPYQINIPWKV